jgi:hypothetical protein
MLFYAKENMKKNRVYKMNKYVLYKYIFIHFMVLPNRVNDYFRTCDPRFVHFKLPAMPNGSPQIDLIHPDSENNMPGILLENVAPKITFVLVQSQVRYITKLVLDHKEFLKIKRIIINLDKRMLRFGSGEVPLDTLRTLKIFFIQLFILVSKFTYDKNQCSSYRWWWEHRIRFDVVKDIPCLKSIYWIIARLEWILARGCPAVTDKDSRCINDLWLQARTSCVEFYNMLVPKEDQMI